MAMALGGARHCEDVFDIVFRTQIIAAIDIRPLDRGPESVHDVSEHPSTLSPV
jgi:hypothetical protein